MILWSDFCTHAASLKGKVRASVWEQVRREALTRLKERQIAGYGREPLDFSDLSARLEDSLLV